LIGERGYFTCSLPLREEIACFFSTYITSGTFFSTHGLPVTGYGFFSTFSFTTYF
jgi:hypothetical protein